MEHIFQIRSRVFHQVLAGQKILPLPEPALIPIDVGDVLELQEDPMDSFGSPHRGVACPPDANDAPKEAGSCRVQVLEILRNASHSHPWLQPGILVCSIRLLDPRPSMDPGAAFAAMQADAVHRLQQHRVFPQPAPVFLAWPQTWPDSTCGFGGVGRAVITVAPTFVWSFPGDPIHEVYHQFRWAYTVVQPHWRFYEAMAAQHLPGACDTDAIVALEPAPFLD